MHSLTVEFDKRPVDKPISWIPYFDTDTCLCRIVTGALIQAQHFGAPIYLEVIDVKRDTNIEAVIIELGSEIYNSEIIRVFEMRYVLKLTEDYIFRCSAPSYRCLSIGPSN